MGVAAFLMMACCPSGLAALAGEHPKVDRQARVHELQDALAKPLSPGSVAMLIEYGDAPEAQERLGAALRDPRSETRAAAARAVNVLGVGGSMPDLLGALEAEKDMDAAREELRAVAALGGPSTDPALFAAASRLRGDLIGALTDVLARRWDISPELRIEDKTPKLHQMSGPRGSAAGRASVTLAAMAALRAKDDALLEVVLRVARTTNTDVDTGMLRDGIQMEVPRIQEAACWHLGLIDPERLPSELKEEVKATASGDTASSFACELAARIVGRPVVERVDWMASLDQEGAKRVPVAPVVLRHLTPGERKTLSQARTGAADSLDKYLERIKSQESHPPKVRAEHGRARKGPIVRLLDLTGFPRGFVPDVLVATGCAGTPPEKWGGAEIAYGRDGRPRTVAFIAGLESLGKCQLATRLLLMSALAPSSGTGEPGDKQIVLVRLDRDFLECSASGSTGGSGSEEKPLVVGGQIREPKKTRTVNPLYPESAKRDRAEGLVVLEATLNISGCVSGLAVVKSAHPALNAAALRAVSDWRYTPTLLDGQPVPVIMTVTVNFRLSY